MCFYVRNVDLRRGRRGLFKHRYGSNPIMNPDVKVDSFPVTENTETDTVSIEAEESSPLNIPLGDLLVDISRQFHFLGET